MKIGILGTGYVGLVSSMCFEDPGNEVTCMDIDEKKVGRLNAEEIPIYEPDLIGIFRRAATQQVLDATTFVHDQKDALHNMDALVLPSHGR